MYVNARKDFMNKTVSRTAKILDYISKVTSGGVGISSISRDLQIPKSSAFDILHTLLDEDFIQYDNEQLRTFKLGLKALHIGFAAVDRLNILQVAKKDMTALYEATKHTVYLAVENNGYVIYVDKLELPGPVQFSTGIGTIKLLHLTGVGKAILAAYNDIEIKDIMTEGCYEVHTPNSIPTYFRLSKEIEEIRSRGYAIENFEDNNFTYSIAAPIYGMNERVCAAVCVSILNTNVENVDTEEIADLVVKTALNISRKMGSNRTTTY